MSGGFMLTTGACMHYAKKVQALLQPLIKNGDRFLRDLPEVTRAPDILGFRVQAYTIAPIAIQNNFLVPLSPSSAIGGVTLQAMVLPVTTVKGGLVPPIITYFALNYHLVFSIPMLIGCLIGGGGWCLALFLGPETKGREMVPDLLVA